METLLKSTWSSKQLEDPDHCSLWFVKFSIGFDCCGVRCAHAREFGELGPLTGSLCRKKWRALSNGEDGC
jgi:hypothetical protein